MESQVLAEEQQRSLLGAQVLWEAVAWRRRGWTGDIGVTTRWLQGRGGTKDEAGCWDAGGVVKSLWHHAGMEWDPSNCSLRSPVSRKDELSLDRSRQNRAGEPLGQERTGRTLLWPAKQRLEMAVIAV